MRNGVIIGVSIAAVAIDVVVLAGEGWPPPVYALAGAAALWILLFAYANIY